MAVRHLFLGLTLACASLWLVGCGDVEKSGCKNLIGDECIPVPPDGTIVATPNPAVEGKAVGIQVHITDPNPAETIKCVLDPEGDGSFQLTVDCLGSRNYIYQETGLFKAAVKATDGQGETIIRTVDVIVDHAADGIPVTEFRLLDAARRDVTGATVCVIPAGASACDTGIVITETSPGIYGATPSLPQDDPDAKEFKLQITQGVTAPLTLTLDVRVDNDNAPASVTFITPFDCLDPMNCSNANAQSSGTIATLSGVIRSSATGAPVANAQVSISGGNETGGPFSTVFTNSLGQFDLLINVGSNLTSAIANSTLLIFADGFGEVVSQFSVTPRHFFGLNFEIEPLAEPPVRLFRETFEASSTTASSWTAAGGITTGASDAHTKWQLVNASDNIVNLNVGQCIGLAPGDLTAAKLPAPVEGQRAFWYGQRNTGSFVGDAVCGGVSSSGTLTSPAISLAGASNPLRLTFKTFWEIESVNPNSSGFDLMRVLISTDGGQNFDQVGKLNPLTDPVGGNPRAPKPYTNTGFNSPPLWIQQETFALPNVAGQEIILRFDFDTNDGLYNEFRGWMIDDIIIEPGQGTLGDAVDN